MKTKIIVGAALLFSIQAAASAADFTGFSAGINLSINGTSHEISATDTKWKSGDNSISGTIQGAYGWKTSDNSVLGFGASYGLSDIKSGEISSGGTTVTYKTKDVWNVYVEPGIILNSSLLYAKFGSTGMKTSGDNNGTTFEHSFNGISYGAGFRTVIDKKIYVQIEALQFDWGSDSTNGATIKPKSTQGSIGIGSYF
jgi:hypothetical protein